MAEGGEKTESATPRRRQEARESGNIARSTDLSAAVILLVAILILYYLGMNVMAGMKATLETLLAGHHATNLTRTDDLEATLFYLIRMIVGTLSPLLLGIAAVALVASISQVGFLITFKPLQPDLAKLSPLKGLKNIGGAKAGMRLVMSLAKTIAIIALAITVIHGDLPAILMMAELSAMSTFHIASQMVYSLALKMAAALVVLAIIDYMYQRWQHDRDMRMSKEEVKEEMRRMEGDPLVKQRRARVARQLAMQRLGTDVPKADVVVTNPTHFAIALRYDPQTMRAPKVIAKGADFMAMRIRQIAIANGVPLVERKELARGLYKAVDVGQEVPAEFYNTVAEILAYVYRLSGRRSA